MVSTKWNEGIINDMSDYIKNMTADEWVNSDSDQILKHMEHIAKIKNNDPKDVLNCEEVANKVYDNMIKSFDTNKAIEYILNHGNCFLKDGKIIDYNDIYNDIYKDRLETD